MDTETKDGLRRNLLEALQALALPPADQVRVSLPGCVSCDLYEDFRHNYEALLELFLSEFTDTHKEALNVVAEALQALPDEACECFNEVMLEHPAWQVVRLASQQALKALNWKLETPSEYVEIKPGVWKRP